MNGLFAGIQQKLKAVYSHLQQDYSEHLLNYLLEPANIVEKNISIEMDNGSKQSFQAFRSQHCDIRGPFKGGIRFHQNVSLDEVKALSAWMSIKTAVVNLPLGGGKGGIIVNPKELSSQELEKLSRAYIQAIASHI